MNALLSVQYVHTEFIRVVVSLIFSPRQGEGCIAAKAECMGKFLLASYKIVYRRTPLCGASIKSNVCGRVATAPALMRRVAPQLGLVQQEPLLPVPFPRLQSRLSLLCL